MKGILSILKGFRDFLLRGNVIDLAVAIVVGSAFNGVVNAFVKDVVSPLIAAIGGQRDFSHINFTVNNSVFMVGDFINALISFLISTTVIYFLLVLPMNRITKGLKASQEPGEKKCPECLSKIPAKATRCKFCTAVLQPAK